MTSNDRKVHLQTVELVVSLVRVQLTEHIHPHDASVMQPACCQITEHMGKYLRWVLSENFGNECSSAHDVKGCDTKKLARIEAASSFQRFGGNWHSAVDWIGDYGKPGIRTYLQQAQPLVEYVQLAIAVRLVCCTDTEMG